MEKTQDQGRFWGNSVQKVIGENKKANVYTMLIYYEVCRMP